MNLGIDKQKYFMFDVFRIGCVRAVEEASFDGMCSSLHEFICIATDGPTEQKQMTSLATHGAWVLYLGLTLGGDIPIQQCQGCADCSRFENRRLEGCFTATNCKIVASDASLIVMSYFAHLGSISFLK